MHNDGMPDSSHGIVGTVALMEIFLVPVGQDRYELYCEWTEDQKENVDKESGLGIFSTLGKRLKILFKKLQDNESEDGHVSNKWSKRLGMWVARWATKVIAEQRLLWYLRRQDEVLLFHPEDLVEAQAMEIVLAHMKRDSERHRLWLVAYGFFLLLAGVLSVLPGPNFLAYYFSFRVVGHYLSWRGARCGLRKIRWKVCGSSELVMLREAISRAPDERVLLVEEVATRLHLERLGVFFEKLVTPST